MLALSSSVGGAHRRCSNAHQRCAGGAAASVEPQTAVLPQIVSDRILGRIALFSGLPLLLGFSSGPLVYYLKAVRKMDLSAGLLYGAGTATFALAAAGITYGVLSASWDPSREGSALGAEEFSRNLPVLLDRLPFFRKRR